MPKALIAYFSQGGTTEAIAKKISDGLQDEKFQVDLHNIAESKPPDISEYDMIGIGSPVYIFRPPFNVSDYLNSLPESSFFNCLGMSWIPVFTGVTTFYQTINFDKRYIFLSYSNMTLMYCIASFF